MAHYTGFDPGTMRHGGGRPPASAPASPYFGRSAEIERIARLRAESSAAQDLSGRAAVYVRMSTDHQRYSTANQRDAMAGYAREQGLEIVRDYADEGKSGLDALGRGGLCALLEDVLGGRADFRTVLVYDVSRWGRFQDVDESAFYEYLCRRAGVRVEYCMEPFRNDGSPMSAVMKGLKRVMAGEYSRELSVKVLASKRRMIALGYRAGGMAGFGLRRMLLDDAGKARGVLEAGQQKMLQSDRVVLVPGPPEEQKIVRWIFRQIADGVRTPTQIAAELNRRGVRPPGRRPWNGDRVLLLVSNEKYIGNLIYNKFSTTLKTRKRANPPDQWFRKDAAFPGIVDPALFDRAQRAMAGWSTRISSARALELLAGLLARHGRLSASIIDAADGMPGSVFYEHRFGGLTRAYAEVGFTPQRDYGFVEGCAWRRRLLASLREEVAQKLAERGAAVERESDPVFRVNRLRVAVMLGRCKPRDGRPCWLVQMHTRPHPDWALVALLNPEGTAVNDYWLVSGGKTNILFGGLFSTRKDERHQASTLGPLLDLIAGRYGGEAGETAGRVGAVCEAAVPARREDQ